MCLIHKWEYEVIPVGSESLNGDVYGRAIRICRECFKKQKTKTGAGLWNFKIKNYVHDWELSELTKAELRDLKLKKLVNN
jgi:hypothetical protein